MRRSLNSPVSDLITSSRKPNPERSSLHKIPEIVSTIYKDSTPSEPPPTVCKRADIFHAKNELKTRLFSIFFRFAIVIIVPSHSLRVDHEGGTDDELCGGELDSFVI